MQDLTDQLTIIQLEQRVALLERIISDHELTISKLDESVIHHQKVIFDLEAKIRILIDLIRNNSGAGIAKESEETPPPHY